MQRCKGLILICLSSLAFGGCGSRPSQESAAPRTPLCQSDDPQALLPAIPADAQLLTDLNTLGNGRLDWIETSVAGAIPGGSATAYRGQSGSENLEVLCLTHSENLRFMGSFAWPYSIQIVRDEVTYSQREHEIEVTRGGTRGRYYRGNHTRPHETRASRAEFDGYSPQIYKTSTGEIIIAGSKANGGLLTASDGGSHTITLAIQARFRFVPAEEPAAEAQTTATPRRRAPARPEEAPRARRSRLDVSTLPVGRYEFQQLYYRIHAVHEGQEVRFSAYQSGDRDPVADGTPVLGPIQVWSDFPILDGFEIQEGGRVLVYRGTVSFSSGGQGDYRFNTRLGRAPVSYARLRSFRQAIPESFSDVIPGEGEGAYILRFRRRHNGVDVTVAVAVRKVQ
jgi:hypothetical protein